MRTGFCATFTAVSFEPMAADAPVLFTADVVTGLEIAGDSMTGKDNGANNGLEVPATEESGDLVSASGDSDRRD